MTPELAALLEALHRQVAPVSPDTRLRIARLLALRPDLAGDALDNSLVALIATDAEQAERVRAFLAKHRRAAAKTRPHRRYALLILVALSVGAGAGWWAALHLPAPIGLPKLPDLSSISQAPHTDVAPTTTPTARLIPQDGLITRYEPWHRPLPLLGLTLGLLLLIPGIRLLQTYRRREARADQQARADAEAAARDRAAMDVELRHQPLPPPERWAEPPAGHRGAAHVLGSLAHPAPSDDLDIEATAAATAEAGGFPLIRFAARATPRALTVFIDREGGHHAWLGGFRALTDAWREAGIGLDVFDFSVRPDRLRDAAGRYHPLDVLAARADGPLVVASRRLLWEDREGASRWPDTLTAWSPRAWLDPDPRPLEARGDDEGQRSAEALVARGLARFPMDSAGLLALARHLTAEAGTTPAEPPSLGVPSPATPGYRRALDRWKAALAVVPDADYDLVDLLRREVPGVAEVFGHRTHLQALLDELHREDATQAGLAGRRPGDERVLYIKPDHARRWIAALRHDEEGRELLDGVFRRLLAELNDKYPPTDPIEVRREALKKAQYRFWLAKTPENLNAIIALRGTAVDDEVREVLTTAAILLGDELPAATRDALVGKATWLPWTQFLRGGWRSTALAAGAAGAGLVGLAVWLSPGQPSADPEDGVRAAGAVAMAQGVVEVPDAEVDAASTPDAAVDAAPPTGSLPPSLRPEMLPIPAGTFAMGSPPDEDGRDDDEPQHRVTLARGFWLGRTEVTQAQWQAVMGDNPSSFKENGAQRPVEQVSWFDALRYLNALSKREGLEPCYNLSGCGADGECSEVKFEGLACPGYRLPTEAEWEYAARAGSQAATYGKLDDIAWYDANAGGMTHPVATKGANAWGLHDMLGNVWEWVHDAYQEDITANATGAPIEAPMPRLRVNRGCGWNFVAVYCRAAYRDRIPPGFRDRGLGFRPARSRSLDP